jgi:large subunit ribosomal protein L21
MADYAIVESGGQQFRVEKGTELVVNRMPDDEGAKVLLRPVAFMGGDNVVAAGDDLEKVKVEAKVAEHMRGPKLTVFKYKAKKGYRRRAGHRQDQTRLEVTEVKLLSRKPAAKKPAAKKSEKEGSE